MGHFSPRSLARAMSRTVIRRVPLPPYSALLPSEDADFAGCAVRAAVWAAESCVMATAPNTSSRGALTASPDHVHGCTSDGRGPGVLPTSLCDLRRAARGV